MKNSLLALLILMSNYAHSQGLIVNEISNGTSGTKEFIELLVVGSQTQTIGQVDINGWVIDDNNGDFDALTSSGVASGHYRFVGMPLVNIGDIIVIYNSSDPNTNIVSADPNDSNSDGVYIIPINHPYIERCTSLPSSTTSSSYVGSTYSYSATQTWNSMGFRNGGDVGQVRRPDYSFYHGFSYGDVTNNFPNFPIEFGGGQSFNVASGSGSGSNYYLDCGDWTVKANYSKGSAIGDTPGFPNTANNAIMISNIKSGTFDYSNLGSPNNCQQVIFNIENIRFTSINKDGDNHLIWDMCDEFESIELQYSYDGISFESLSYNSCGYVHYNVNSDIYYRLICEDVDGEILTSKTIFQRGYENDVMIYPNPTSGLLNIFSEVSYEIYSVDGKMIVNGFGNTVNVDGFESSVYVIKLIGKDFVKVLKFLKY